MAEYYKYVARDADSQINYAEIGQQAVDTLQDWYNTREEKKEAYKQASRESINNLMDAPQGQNQDANKFINNYAHDMINQKMVDKDLFERGYLSEKEYTLRMQNQMDGTKQLFQIQKLYQENFAATMQGIQDGTLQNGINVFNMSMVEGYGDFNNSKATINPADGSVGIGLMENKIVDGQTVRVLSTNIAPVNVIRGKILQKAAKFDVDGKTTSFVENLGDKKDAIYSAASTARAGSITEYTGYEFIKNLKDPADRQIAEDFSKAINDNIESYWAASPYNLTSVLTDNLGKYDSKSFTFDKNLADKDPNKILVTIDPNTQMTTLDKSGKNYKAQMEEANSYVRTQILSKLDAERKISTTTQLQAQYKPEYVAKGDAEAERIRELNKNIAQNLVFSLTGDANKSRAGTQYLTATTKTPINKTKDGYTVTDASGNVQTYKFKADGKTLADPLGFSKSFIGVMKGNLPDLNEDQVLKYVQQFLPKGARINQTTEAKGYDTKQAPEKPLQVFVRHIDKVVPESTFLGQKDESGKYTQFPNDAKIAENMNNQLAGTGFEVESALASWNNEIRVTNKNKDKSPWFKIGKPGDKDAVKKSKEAFAAAKKWMKANTTAKKIGTVQDKDAYAEELLKANIIGGGGAAVGAGELD